MDCRGVDNDANFSECPPPGCRTRNIAPNFTHTRRQGPSLGGQVDADDLMSFNVRRGCYRSADKAVDARHEYSHDSGHLTIDVGTAGIDGRGHDTLGLSQGNQIQEAVLFLRLSFGGEVMT